MLYYLYNVQNQLYYNYSQVQLLEYPLLIYTQSLLFQQYKGNLSYSNTLPNIYVLLVILGPLYLFTSSRVDYPKVTSYIYQVSLTPIFLNIKSSLLLYYSVNAYNNSFYTTQSNYQVDAILYQSSSYSKANITYYTYSSSYLKSSLVPKLILLALLGCILQLNNTIVASYYN